MLDTVLVTETSAQETPILQQNSPSPLLDLDGSVASVEASVVNKSAPKLTTRHFKHSSLPQIKQHNAGPTRTEADPQDID